LILGSLQLADALLKVETPSGPCWRRYFDDGYGEHDDGSAYDGWGRGRPWPLLTGERAHYEIASGRDPLPLMEAMARMASPGGMLPEQIWDAPSIPEIGLQTGQATGSAMPLAWTHSEFVKLVASRALGRPFDRPEAVWRRYRGERVVARRAIWAPHAPISDMQAGVSLIIVLPAPANVHYGFDGWQNVTDATTMPNALGVHVLHLDTSKLKPGQRLDFTYWNLPNGASAGVDYRISISAPV
jgi:glucoamylase